MKCTIRIDPAYAQNPILLKCTIRIDPAYAENNMPSYVERQRAAYIATVKRATKGEVGPARAAAALHGLKLVDLCCKGVNMPMGDEPQQWYGMLPPDRMHLWWEGMGKHVLDWTVEMIDTNFKNKKETGTTGSLALLDLILVNLKYKNRYMQDRSWLV